MKEIVTDHRILDTDRYILNALVISLLNELPKDKTDSYGLATTLHNGNLSPVLGPTTRLAEGIASGELEPGLEGIPPLQQVAARLVVAWMNDSEEALDLAISQLTELAADTTLGIEPHTDAGIASSDHDCLGCLISLFLDTLIFICRLVKEGSKCT